MSELSIAVERATAGLRALAVFAGDPLVEMIEREMQAYFADGLDDGQLHAAAEAVAFKVRVHQGRLL